MIFTNGWKSRTKQNGKVIFKWRVGVITIIDFYFDKPKKQIGFTLFNFGVKNGFIQKREL